MKVLILAGGLGTRLNEETAMKPKAMVEIGEKPILWHIMKVYSQYGYNDFVLLLGYKGHMIEEYFNNNPEPKWKIKFVDTGLESSKAQRIMKVKKYISEDYFFVAYGDDLSDVSPKEILEFHKSQGKIVTLTAIPLESDFGVLEISNNGVVKRFMEKPKIEGYWINGGFFCFSKEIFAYLNDEEELEDQIFKKLAEKGEIAAFKHLGFWKCMNTYKEKINFNKLWNENKARWKNW